MGLYGPFTAVAGTIEQRMLDGSAEAIYVRNTSIYDLAISFIIPRPVQVSAFGGGAWSVIVPAGDRVGIRVPLGTYGGGNFPGWVWVLPINNTTTLALTGVTSANANFWIETYEDAAVMPGDYASAQFQNIASQPRVISLPIGMTHWSTGLFASGLVNTRNTIAPAFNLTAAQKSALTAVFYVYYVAMMPVSVAVAAGADVSLILTFWNAINGGGAIVGTDFSVVRFGLTQAANGASPPVVIAPAEPFAQIWNGSIPAAAQSVTLGFFTNGASASVNFDYVVAGNLDLTNLVPNADIGTAALYNITQANF